jgi:hypothetical protein
MSRSSPTNEENEFYFDLLRYAPGTMRYAILYSMEGTSYAHSNAGRSRGTQGGAMDFEDARGNRLYGVAPSHRTSLYAL